MNVFVFKTQFADGRDDHHFHVVSSSLLAAEIEAELVVRGMDLTGYGTDESADAEFICELNGDDLHDELSITL